MVGGGWGGVEPPRNDPNIGSRLLYRLVPLMVSAPGTVYGSGSPASAASVGKMSTISASTAVSWPTAFFMKGARTISGMCTPSSKFVLDACVIAVGIARSIDEKWVVGASG